MRSLRIWFTKQGDLKYLSHLDLMRYMLRIFRRTDIPIWYTEGYNPRPHIVFCLSLPLGVEGENEIFDIRFADDAYPDEMVIPALNAVTVPGIDFLRAEKPVHPPQDVAFAEYSAFMNVGENAGALSNAALTAVHSGSLTIEKKSKRGVLKEVNVCESLKSFEAYASDEVLSLHFTLPAGNMLNINPLAFCGAVFEETGLDPRLLTLTRKRLLLPDLTEFR